MNTPFFLFPLDFVLLKLLGKLLFLLLFHVTMQMFGGIAESRRHQDLSVLTQFISDPDEELLQLHSIFKDLRICPAGSKWYNKTKAFFSYSKPITSMHKNTIRPQICTGKSAAHHLFNRLAFSSTSNMWSWNTSSLLYLPRSTLDLIISKLSLGFSGLAGSIAGISASESL